MWNAYYIWLKRKFTKKEVGYNTTIPEVTPLMDINAFWINLMHYALLYAYMSFLVLQPLITFGHHAR